MYAQCKVLYISCNFTNRQVRKVIGCFNDKVMDETTALKYLDKYFGELEKNSLEEHAWPDQKIMENALGFSIMRAPSNVSGTGVFVSSGRVKKGSLVSIYPGMMDTI